MIFKDPIVKEQRCSTVHPELIECDYFIGKIFQYLGPYFLFFLKPHSVKLALFCNQQRREVAADRERGLGTSS